MTDYGHGVSSPEEFRAFVNSRAARRFGFDLKEVAPDVYADVHESPQGTLTIPIVESGDPGKGKVGAWLDSLANRHVQFIGVVNDRFEGMLIRRGYRCINRAEGNWQHKPGLRP